MEIKTEGIWGPTIFKKEREGGRRNKRERVSGKGASYILRLLQYMSDYENQDGFILGRTILGHYSSFLTSNAAQGREEKLGRPSCV